MIKFTHQVIIMLLSVGTGILIWSCSPSSYTGKRLNTENFHKMFRNHMWTMKTIRAVYADGTCGKEDRRSSWVPPVSVSFICDNDSLYEFSQDYREFPPIDYYTSGKIYEYDNNSHILSLNNLKMIGYGKLKQMEVVYISNDSMQCIGPIIDDVSKDSLAVKSLIEFKADTIPSSYRDFVRKKQYHINIE